MTLPFSAAHFSEIENILQRYSDIEAKLPLLLTGSKSDLAEAIFCLYGIQTHLSELGRIMPILGTGLQAPMRAKHREIAMTVQMLRENRRNLTLS